MIILTTILKNGSKGEDVKKVQEALLRLGYYAGGIDGDFGSKTEVSVKRFQMISKLTVDGIVGQQCVQALNALLSPSELVHISTSSLLSRCLKLTASIETGESAPKCYSRVSGNFDGQAVSFGALQWNFGRKTLINLFQIMYRECPQKMSSVLSNEDNIYFQQLLSGPHATLMDFFVGMQRRADKSVWIKWQSYFKQIGLQPECIAIQERLSQSYFNKAVNYCKEYGLTSERAVALMFDICVQNGSIPDQVRSKIFYLFRNSFTEEGKLLIIANCRAEAALPRWIDDVRARKSGIAKGSGIIHGKNYHLKNQFGIDLIPASGLQSSDRLTG